MTYYFKRTSLILLLLLPLFCLSQIPSYYSSVDFNNNGATLQIDLEDYLKTS